MLKPPSPAGTSRGGVPAPPLFTSRSSSGTVRVRSSILGRTRWHVPALVDQPNLAERIVGALLDTKGVTAAVANPLTGGVLATYEPTVPVSSLTAFLITYPLAPPATSNIPARASKPVDPVPANGGTLTFTKLITGNPEHERLAKQVVMLALLNRTVDSAPTTLISTAIDVVTRGPGSFLGKLGFASIRSQLLALSGIGLTIWLIDAALGYYYSVATAKLGSAVQDDLLRQVYDHLQGIDPARIENKSVSDWMALMDGDVSHVAEFIEKGVDPVVAMATKGLVAAGTFLAISPGLAAVQFLSMPCLFYVVTRFLGPIKERRVVARKAETAMLATLHNNIAGMSTIAVSATQDTEAARVAEASTRYKEATRRMALLSSAYAAAIKTVVAPGFLIALGLGGRRVEQDLLAPSSYSMMLYSSLRLYSALGHFGITLDYYQKATVSLNRVDKFLSEGPKILSGDTALPLETVRGDVSLENASFGYSLDKKVIHHLKMHLPAGKTIGIVGPSGAGKTTILRLLLRFYDVDAGRVTIDGLDIRNLHLANLRRAIAYVPQNVFLTSGTIRENIAYLRPDASPEEVTRAARLAAADEFIEAMPGGYETRVGFGGVELSGGQRQRIAIARTMLSDAPILLFDEATSAVDNETEAIIQRSLMDVAKDRTTIIVAHRLSTIRQCDLIYVLDDGQVREQGRHDELVRADGVYASMWRIQTGEAPPANGGGVPTISAPTPTPSLKGRESESGQSDVPDNMLAADQSDVPDNTPALGQSDVPDNMLTLGQSDVPDNMLTVKPRAARPRTKKPTVVAPPTPVEPPVDSPPKRKRKTP